MAKLQLFCDVISVQPLWKESNSSQSVHSNLQQNQYLNYVATLPGEMKYTQKTIWNCAYVKKTLQSLQ